VTILFYLLYLGAVYRIQPWVYDPTADRKESEGLWYTFNGVGESTVSKLRCQHREANNKLMPPDWFSSAFTKVDTAKYLVGYEVCDCIRRLHKELGNGWNDVAVVESLSSQDCPGVGLATHFLSHSQAENVFKTLEAMDSFEFRTCTIAKKMLRLRFFLDYLNIRQNVGGDFKPDAVETVISRIGRTAVLLYPMAAPIVLSRCWCVFELSCSVQSLNTIVAAPVEETIYVEDCIQETEEICETLRVRLEDCSARDESDKTMILNHIKKGIGTAKTNAAVEHALKTTLHQQLELLLTL